jgi:hypothetical protein
MNILTVLKISLILSLLTGCSYSHLDDVKENSTKVFKEAGYDVTGYYGYRLGLVIPFTNYGGANVYYELSKGNGITYKAFLNRWGDEYHIYSLKAIDAIKP